MYVSNILEPITLNYKSNLIEMKLRYIIGYILVGLGIIAMLVTSASMISILKSLPQAPNLGAAIISAIGIGILIVAYIVSNMILLIPGSLLIKSHKSNNRLIVGGLIILVGLAIIMGLRNFTSAEPAVIPIFLTFPLTAAVITITTKARYGLITLILMIIIDALVYLTPI